MTKTNIKASKFNVYIHGKENMAIYNCATGKWSWFSLSDAAHIQRQRISSLSKEVFKTALKSGILVKAKTDENKWYEKEFQNRIKKDQAFYVIASTFKCNLKCPYCFEENHNTPQKSITQKKLNNLIKAIKQRSQLNKIKQLEIMLLGGDPLLEMNKNLYLLKHLKEWCDKNSVRFMGTISTNGSLLSEKTVQQFKPYIGSAQVTFDGPRDIHDCIRTTHKGQPTFDKIVNSIKLLTKNQIKVKICSQVQADKEEALFSLVNELKAEGLLSSPYIQMSIGLLRNFSKWSPCLNRWNHIEPDSEIEQRLLSLSNSILPVQRPAVQITPCIMAGNILCVDPMGNLYKCIASQLNVEQKVGTISSKGEFVFNEHFFDFNQRNPLLFSDCSECSYLPLCGGGCPKIALEKHDTYKHSFCGHSKFLLYNRIRKMILSHENKNQSITLSPP